MYARKANGKFNRISWGKIGFIKINHHEAKIVCENNDYFLHKRAVSALRDKLKKDTDIILRSRKNQASVYLCDPNNEQSVDVFLKKYIKEIAVINVDDEKPVIHSTAQILSHLHSHAVENVVKNEIIGSETTPIVIEDEKPAIDLDENLEKEWMDLLKETDIGEELFSEIFENLSEEAKQQEETRFYTPQNK